MKIGAFRIFLSFRVGGENKSDAIGYSVRYRKMRKRYGRDAKTDIFFFDEGEKLCNNLSRDAENCFFVNTFCFFGTQVYVRGCRGGERCATVGTELKSEERRRSSGGALEKQQRK